MHFRPLIQLARPGHWVKNAVVLMPVAFGLKIHSLTAWVYALATAIAVSFICSFSYILNDIKDRKTDVAHPAKKNRPLASGRLTTTTAVIEAVVLLILGVAITLKISYNLLPLVVAFLLLQICYTYLLKSIVLLDVISIAMGFVFRTAIGAVAIKVAVSPWLFICMFTLCLFMGFCKRYSEMITIDDSTIAGHHRPTLIEYTPELLTHLITLSAGIAVVAFLLYGLNDRTVQQFGTNYFVYTLPIVVYAVFRFAMLSMKATYHDPTDLVLHDTPFQVVTIIWGLAMLAIIYWGKDLQQWVDSIYLA